MKHKLESRFQGETSITSDMQVTPPLMKVKEESEKAALKLNIQKTKIMTSGPITSWQVDGGRVEIVSNFIFLGSKVTVDNGCNHKIKRQLLLEW